MRIPGCFPALSLISALPLMTLALAAPANARAQSATITGRAAFTDYSQEAPGVRRKITVADLP